MENHSFQQIVGSPSAPYINNVLVKKGALLTQSYGVEHPSQPNYLDLFSGSNQGVIDDSVPTGTPFSTPNLGAKLFAAGKTFATYSESLPSVGFTGASYTNDPGKNEYQRKHNPMVNWQAEDAPANNHLPMSANQPFTSFPSTAVGYSSLPTVSFVIPNEQHDIHDGTIPDGDTWLKNNLEGYRVWAMTHHSILLLTFDEDDRNSANRITTIFVGQPIIPGKYAETPIARPAGGIDHFNILRTIERRYLLGICNADTDGARKPIANIFRTAAPTSANPAMVEDDDSADLSASSAEQE